MSFFVISALFGGFDLFDGAPSSALALNSSSMTLGQQMLEVHLGFTSRLESQVTKFEEVNKEILNSLLTSLTTRTPHIHHTVQ